MRHMLLLLMMMRRLRVALLCIYVFESQLLLLILQLVLRLGWQLLPLLPPAPPYHKCSGYSCHDHNCTANRPRERAARAVQHPRPV
jgi:hypothetical protein